MSPWICNPKTLSLPRAMEQELHAALIVAASEEWIRDRISVWEKAPNSLHSDLFRAWVREDDPRDMLPVLRREDSTTPPEFLREFELVYQTFESLGWTVRLFWNAMEDEDEDADDSTPTGYYLTLQVQAD